MSIAVPSERAGFVECCGSRENRVFEQVNPTIQRQLPDSYRVFCYTDGFCSCGLYYDPSYPEDDVDEVEVKANKLRRKYEKLGWSQAKIERSISQAVSHIKETVIEPGLHPKVRDLVRGIVAEVGTAIVFVHEYRGYIESEKVALGRKLNCSLSEFSTFAERLCLDEQLVVSR